MYCFVYSLYITPVTLTYCMHSITTTNVLYHIAIQSPPNFTRVISPLKNKQVKCSSMANQSQSCHGNPKAFHNATVQGKSENNTSLNRTTKSNGLAEINEPWQTSVHFLNFSKLHLTPSKLPVPQNELQPELTHFPITSPSENCQSHELITSRKQIAQLLPRTGHLQDNWPLEHTCNLIGLTCPLEHTCTT